MKTINSIRLIIKDNIGLNARGQSALEYAVVIACIVTALLAMQAYVRRGISGRLKSSADQIGRQYEPGKTDSDMKLEITSDVITEVNTEEKDGKLTTTTTVTLSTDDDGKPLNKERRHGHEIVVEE